jgi:AmmeMemoRadiSam system protein A/AmmeMemoRadiSam system protein B
MSGGAGWSLREALSSTQKRNRLSRQDSAFSSLLNITCNPISVWAEGGFETPLGVVPVDVKLAQALIAADPRITFDPSTFQGEHMIEIELPFLQRTCPGCSIVPILMGTDDEEVVQALAKALLPALAGRRAVVIASSDLSHYPKREDAVRVDNATLAAIETGDPARVRETIAAQMSAGIPNLVTCACSEGPILVAMRVAQGLGANRTTILHYANSADAPGGDPTQVVGYGAVMFWRNALPDLTQPQRNELLKLARAAIAEKLKTGHIPDYTTDDPALMVHSGAFVTLNENADPSTGLRASPSTELRASLRGCIGEMQADIPLYRLVQEMAVAAATSDPRFPPLRSDELSKVSIEISVLSPLQRITDVQQIQVGTHGLMIVQDGQRGVFLPQLPIEQGWNRDRYLEELCGKAGLPSGCWRDLQQATLYTFTAVVFGE